MMATQRPDGRGFDPRSQGWLLTARQRMDDEGEADFYGYLGQYDGHPRLARAGRLHRPVDARGELRIIEPLSPLARHGENPAHTAGWPRIQRPWAKCAPEP